MTIKECYNVIGGDYDDVMSRLRTDDRIKRFLLKVADDKSCELLETSLADRDMPTAFRAAHTLKGVCLNLSITRLHNSASAITEALRDRTEYTPDLEPMFAKVKKEFEETVAAIRSVE